MSFGGRKTFLYYLCDPAGRSYYVDSGGQILLSSTPRALKQAPEGWMESVVAFGRNATYHGINRTFTIPLKFVGDGAKIIRHLVYTKRGIEQPVMLVVLKWDPDTDIYELYYKGKLELPKQEDVVAEGVTVHVMEGGVAQLLKAYENTVFQIPCDGSIPENIRVRFDGIQFRDTFHYQGIAIGGINTTAVLPAVFAGNEGDNIGILHNDPTFETFIDINYFPSSLNYVFSSVINLNVRVVGKIKVRPTSGGAVAFSLAAITSGPIQIELVSSGPLAPGDNEFSFDSSIGLGANEHLFIAFDAVTGTLEIVEWSFDLVFDSRYRTTVAWGIRAGDLFRLLVEAINQEASDNFQQFNYQAQSQLLEEYSNLVCLSGDALRASSDPNYPGPVVIKTTLKEFFESFNAILNGALGNRTVPGQPEILFFENKEYVYDSSEVTMQIGEVSDLKISIALDYFFNVLKIGYPNQQYEEKAGKYEFNTTAQWSSPIKSHAKELNLVSRYRADPSGIEWTRFHTGGRSTTHNNSDNSVFVVNIDEQTDFDKFTASQQGVLNVAAGVSNQAVSLSIASTDYFSPNQNFTEFTFIRNINSPQFTVKLSATAGTTGPGGIAFSVLINGNVALTINGSGFINDSNSVNGIIFNEGDKVEVKVSTDAGTTAVVAILNLEIISEQIQIYLLKRVNYDSISGLINPDTYFNIEDLTPKRMLLRHGNYLKSTLFNLTPGRLTFRSLDRNQLLSTTKDGVTITEDADVPISSFPAPLFYWLVFKFKTKVPLNFMDLLAGAANGHIHFTYNGVDLYGFPLEVTQKPALNESQEWTLLCSPRTNLADLVDLDIDGLNYLDMAGLSTFIPHLNPVHFVPLGYAQPSQYHHLTMEQDWFKNRIRQWIAQNDYFNPWQNDDVIKLQVQTNGLSPVQVEVLNCNAEVVNTIEMDVVMSDAVRSPNIAYQANVPLAGLEEGVYYLLVKAGVGEAMTRFISEPLHVKEEWPETLLLEYSHHTNKQAVIFTEGYRPGLRVPGRIVRYTPGARFAVYENEPADLEMINGIPYDSFKLEIGYAEGGVPDYIIRKLSRILLLSDLTIDGTAYTREKESEWERVNYPGQPKEFWSIDIRYADNRDGIMLSTDGSVDQNVTIVYNINASAFGDNSGVSNVIQVEEEDQ